MAKLRIAYCFILVLAASMAANAQTAYIIDSDGTNHLWSLNLATGVATDIGGPLNYSQIEGLATSAGGTIYGVDDETDTLVTINTSTAVATAVGSGDGNLGVDVNGVGLAFDAAGDLWMTSENTNALYSVNPATGGATLIDDTHDPDITGLAACGTLLFGLADNVSQFASLDPVTGASTIIGGLNNVTVPDDGGLTFAGNGVLFGVSDDDEGAGTSEIFTIDILTGNATYIADVTDGVDPIVGIESITSTSAPPAFCAGASVPMLGGSSLAVLVLLVGAAAIWVIRFRLS